MPVHRHFYLLISMEKTLLLPLTLESRFLFPFTTSPLLAFWERLSKAKKSTVKCEKPRKAQLPLKEGVTVFGSTHPCCKLAKHWALGVYEQLFIVKWQHLFMCLVLWPWNTLPKESSAISNLPRHFTFPTASNSINRQLITITVSPQEVKLHKSNFQPHRPKN